MRDYIEVRLRDIENDIDDIKNSIHTIEQKPRLLYLYGFINEKPEMIAVFTDKEKAEEYFTRHRLKNSTKLKKFSPLRQYSRTLLTYDNFPSGIPVDPEK